MSFHVGQKVVCVDATDHLKGHPGAYGDLDGLQKGAIYTIRETGLFSEWDGQPCVRLEELRREDPHCPDYPYWARRFRPIIERKTDISIFQKMLTDAPKEMEAAE